MFAALMRLLGFAHKEYDHIVTDLTSMASDLATLAERKKAVADTQDAVIKDAGVVKDAAMADAVKATTAAKKIAALVTP